jgi:hypothetical protein
MYLLHSFPFYFTWESQGKKIANILTDLPVSGTPEYEIGVSECVYAGLISDWMTLFTCLSFKGQWYSMNKNILAPKIGGLHKGPETENWFLKNYSNNFLLNFSNLWTPFQWMKVHKCYLQESNSTSSSSTKKHNVSLLKKRLDWY